MPLQNKNRIAYLISLSLLFSYVEMFLPKVIPFFKLGLGNTIVLLSLTLDFPSFFVFNVIRILANCMLSGTLFSPFALISLCQGIASGLMMYFLKKLFKSEKLMSVYGISMVGSAISGVVQILVTSLYLDKGCISLLGPMLAFSLLSGIITAFLSQVLNIPEETPGLIEEIPLEQSEKTTSPIQLVLMVIMILISLTLVVMIKSVTILLFILAIAFIFQLLCGRKILILPHLFLWIFVLFCTIFTPNGKVLFSIGSLSVTQGALLSGVTKALKLSIISAISQACVSMNLNMKKDSLMSLTLSYFSGLCNVFRTTEGNYIAKVKKVMAATSITCISHSKKGISLVKTIILSVLILGLFGVSLIY